MSELGLYEDTLGLPPTAQCPRCGRDFRPDGDPFSPDNEYCGPCADHAVLCGCNDEFCGEA